MLSVAVLAAVVVDEGLLADDTSPPVVIVSKVLLMVSVVFPRLGRDGRKPAPSLRSN